MGKSIKEMLLGMVTFFTGLFDNLPKWVEQKMPDILKITKALRHALEKGDEWLNSQTADTITAIIPGDMDDNIRRVLILIMEKAMPVVVHIDENAQTFGEKLLHFLQHMQSWDTEKGKLAKLMALASIMLKLWDDHKLPENRYDTLAQLAYSKLEGKEEEIA